MMITMARFAHLLGLWIFQTRECIFVHITKNIYTIYTMVYSFCLLPIVYSNRRDGVKSCQVGGVFQQVISADIAALIVRPQLVQLTVAP